MANFRAVDIPLVIKRDQKSCVTALRHIMVKIIQSGVIGLKDWIKVIYYSGNQSTAQEREDDQQQHM